MTPGYAKPDIPGADSVVEWFGYWPTFHDAEVIAIALNRTGPSSVVLHAFEMTSQVDPQGFYVLSKHATVTFSFEGFEFVRIVGFNAQNVLSSLWITRIPEGFELNLEEAHGVSGIIKATSMQVRIEPRIPTDSFSKPSVP
jgi:hypothetical protein